MGFTGTQKIGNGSQLPYSSNLPGLGARSSSASELTSNSIRDRLTGTWSILRKRAAGHIKRDTSALKAAGDQPDDKNRGRLGAFAASFQRGGILQPFRLISQDLRNLRGRYASDWAVFNQRIFASAVYVFFTNILPGITFASDLDVLTGQSWGTIEVVFSTGLCGLIFSVFSAQPLTILGVTGPFSVLAENIYSLCVRSFHIDFLQFMAWSLIHAAWMHYLAAIFNAHDYTMRYVTHFSADIFSLLNSVIYFQKAILELQRNKTAVSMASFLYSVIGAAGTCLLAVFLSTADKHWAPLFGHTPRMLLTEYAAAISIILFIGMPHVGDLATLDQQRLSVQTELRPTSLSRSVFVVRFWELPARWALAAMLPGAIITVLFFFDHEISSIICTLKRYGIRKPGGFAWDIVLLGTTTAICGILGIPPANGLLPQAPLHSESLRHAVPVTGNTSKPCALGPETGPVDSVSQSAAASTKQHVRVYEQRYSAFLQSALILAFVSPPLQHLLGLTTTSVLAGLFLFMGYQSLAVNPILGRVAHLLTPPAERDVVVQQQLPESVRWSAVHAYTLTQIAATAAVFGVTLTVAAPVFPVLIIILVPLRLTLMKKIWSRDALRWVDSWACREGKPEDEPCQSDCDSCGESRQAAASEKRDSLTRQDTERSLSLAKAQSPAPSDTSPFGGFSERGVQTD
ncbi:hypothetical protein SEPCBS119000_000111 [Sporothrix epigloea]|uniref:Bicarbonate transporter-like transmembrane domain-containing protein n=1 Tax=Sporothrix epigloea TaxID=1892477 RepID=A0ABP0D394_9PEZI